MKKRILVSSRSMQLVIDEWRQAFEEIGYELVLPSVTQRLQEDQLIEYVHDVVGVLAGDDFFTKDVLDQAPHLRAISKWGTGLDSIDLQECARRNIAVTNTVGAFTEAVADSTLGYILNFIRGLSIVDADMRRGVWKKYPFKAMHEVTIGVIGVGRIGQAVGERLTAFGTTCLGCDPATPPTDFLASTKMEMTDLSHLLKASDVVTLHCDLNETSRQLMAEHEFRQMKRSAFLINVARGGVTNEEDLVEALKQGEIAGAAIDAFATEPLPATHPFFELANVTLAPHCANSSPAAYEKVVTATAQNLLMSLAQPIAVN